jgi:hypothetical protein
MSLPAVNGLPPHGGVPFSEIIDPSPHRSNPLKSERGMGRRRSMVVSAVNGTERRSGGSVSAVNNLPLRFFVWCINHTSKDLDLTNEAEQHRIVP